MAAKKPRKRARKAPPKKRKPATPPRDGLPRWWRAYFAAIADNGGFKGRAAAACKIDRTCPEKWVVDHPELKDLFDATMAEALEQASENLMAEAVRRGWKGVLEPVFHQGKKVATIRRFADTLLMFALNARGRGTRQAPQYTLDLSRLTNEQLRRLADGEDPVSVVAMK